MIGVRARYLVLFVLLFILGVAGSVFSEPIKDFILQKEASFRARQLFSECDGNTCYAKELSVLASKRGADYTFEVLHSLQEIDASAKGCHFLAHSIGSGLYREDPSNWKGIIRNVSPACNYGAIHGVMEQHIASLPGGTLTKELVPQVCGDEPRADCNHIVGHLLLVENKGDIDKALDMCSVFENDRQRYFCLSGVFMEEITALNLIEHGYADESFLNWSERVDDLEATCRRYESERARACWKEIVHAALTKYNYNPGEIFGFCKRAESVGSQTACRDHSMGIIAAHHKFNLFSVKEMCKIPQEGEPEFEDKCYGHLVGSMLATIPQEVGKAVDFCISLEEEFKDSCFAMIGNQAGDSACQLVPEENKEKCIGKSAPDVYENLGVN